MRTTPRRAALGPPPANRAKRRDEPPEAGRKRRQRRPAPVLPAPCATPGYLADWAKRAVEFPMPKKDFSFLDVLSCDGIFLTNVMKGVVPISKINGKVVPKKVSYQEFL